ncbi:MAG: hypothetical protein GY852_04145 [bacterium]|nr:hypothetical protein [bacterium]
MGERRKVAPAIIALGPTPSRMPKSAIFQAKPAPDGPGIVQPKRPMNLNIDDSIKRARGTEMAIRLSRALCLIHPEALEGEIKFTQEAIFLNSKKIGDITVDQESVKARIWLQYLGYPFGSLGPKELGDVFEIDAQAFEQNMEKSNYLVMLGLQQGTLDHVGICLYKDFETRVPPAFPLKAPHISR